jgi:hypothetical protein
MEHPFIISNNDRIAFSFNKDTIIRASETWSSDTAFVWVDYSEHGFNDFWEVYLRAKNNEGWKANREVGDFPKKYIFEYFMDKGVELKDIIIYNAYSIVPHKAIFTRTGSSYTGVNFIFKIRKSSRFINRIEKQLLVTSVASRHFLHLPKS